MNKPPQILFSLLLLIAVSLPSIASAGSAAEPFNKIQEPTITAITDTTITVTHTRDRQKKPSKKGHKSDTDATPNPADTVTKTYQITALTDIEVNGQSASASDLKVGMAVSVSADPPSDLSAPDPTNGGVARTILAHDAPASDTPAN